ncbi:hypothetical protein HYH03_005404 [Edaphochlamys debaryana]|uniref:Multicopper oxidase n=1 Tax=Edaphochlamys debaryana TaxID=47281 RepID=A0A835Y7R2_9CHLO|nr:hypothetical protein HYH03_005404 [Edaphochlamys debaryana]|eukprot:KAG2496582.1 hypothetical protein HYH03_005404 [Edaphochlamys debaryana]
MALPLDGDGSNDLSYTAPRYRTTGVSNGVGNNGLQAPAIIGNCSCDEFYIQFKNNLPFQSHHTCPTDGNSVGYNPLAGGANGYLGNGFEDFTWTNLHTHGLKVHPGATNPQNECDGNGFTGTKPSFYDFYCNKDLSAQQLCQVYGDNILVDAHAMYAPPVAAGATLRYQYPLDAHIPGVAMYHPHHHGSVSAQMPTTVGPLIVPESSLPGGVEYLYTPTSNALTPDCNRLKNILKKQPIENSRIIQISGIWFRNKTGAESDQPSDDSQPFVGAPDGPTGRVNPLLFNEADGSPKFSNAAGRDWALLNGAFQPTITMTAKRYDRWNIITAFTMKWLDITIQQLDAAGNPVVPNPSACTFQLLGRDGVPLPTVPRTIKSRLDRNSPYVNNLILNTGNRVDVLVKCDTPGTYVLVSGAGPYRHNPAACQTVHCELFGSAQIQPAPGNNLYPVGGALRELPFAVLATVQVDPLPPTSAGLADATFVDGVCRSKLEQWPYTDYLNFPASVKQCFSFMNSDYGGMCAVNGRTLNIDDLSTATLAFEWEVRDTAYHPFHLHSTPVRMVSLPNCAKDLANMWQEGDGNNIVALPVCLMPNSGCTWTEEGSGRQEGGRGGSLMGGKSGSPVTVCDNMTLEWLAPNFSAPPPPKGQCKGVTKARPEPDCTPKYGMFHCHAIPHEDEGCVEVVAFWCDKEPVLAQCPEFYP